jgi:hypothetical protein
MDEKLEVTFVDEERKRVMIDGVKYIRCWRSCRQRTNTVPKCRKEYMVAYRARKNAELKRLRESVDQHKNVNTEVSSAWTDLETRV